MPDYWGTRIVKPPKFVYDSYAYTGDPRTYYGQRFEWIIPQLNQGWCFGNPIGNAGYSSGDVLITVPSGSELVITHLNINMLQNAAGALNGHVFLGQNQNEIFIALRTPLTFDQYDIQMFSYSAPFPQFREGTQLRFWTNMGIGPAVHISATITGFFIPMTTQLKK